MRENISIQIGKCGIQFGHEFWKQISSDHFINPSGQISSQKIYNRNENLFSFFREQTNGLFIPRTILFDLEPREIQILKNGTYSKFYPETNIIHRTEGSGNNWSNGYIRALEIIQKIEEIFRKDSEKCDSIGSFNIFHSITGGTGSGSTCLILETIREHYPGKIINCYSIIPNQTGQSDIVVQPYNSVLSIRWLNYYADSVILFENESISRILQDENKNFCVGYTQINSIAAKIINNFTLPLRFWDYTETSFESIISTLIPIPNLHFLFGALSDIQVPGKKKIFNSVFPENIRQLLKNKTICSEWKNGKLVASTFFLKEMGIDFKDPYSLKKIFQESNVDFVNWAPISNQKIDLNSLNSTTNFTQENTALFNHSGINNIFMRMGQQFDILKKRNAFLSNFLREFSQRDGKEIFDESRESIEKIITAYNKI